MKYVAYGSNLNVNQMKFRCPTAKKIGSGIIENYELLFRGDKHHAVATIEPKLGSSVQVGIWDIQPSDEKNLDLYEGFPRLYQKDKFEVELENGTTVMAMGYVMDDRYPLNLPSDVYASTILKGYGDFGLDAHSFYEIYNEFYEQFSEDCMMQQGMHQ